MRLSCRPANGFALTSALAPAPHRAIGFAEKNPTGELWRCCVACQEVVHPARLIATPLYSIFSPSILLLWTTGPRKPLPNPLFDMSCCIFEVNRPGLSVRIHLDTPPPSNTRRPIVWRRIPQRREHGLWSSLAGQSFYFLCFASLLSVDVNRRNPPYEHSQVHIHRK